MIQDLQSAVFVVTFFIVAINLWHFVALTLGRALAWPVFELWKRSHILPTIQITPTNWLFFLPSALYQIWFWFARAEVIY